MHSAIFTEVINRDVQYEIKDNIVAIEIFRSLAACDEEFGYTKIDQFFSKLTPTIEKTLKSKNLIEDMGKIIGEGYSRTLRSYKSMLTTTYRFISHTPHAKFFEILASGSIALTNRFDHSDLLFKNKCWVEFKDDCSDILEKAKWIMNNENECVDMKNNAHKEFLEKHTDDIRILELYNVLKTQLEGKVLYKKWSI